MTSSGMRHRRDAHIYMHAKMLKKFLNKKSSGLGVWLNGISKVLGLSLSRGT